MKSNYNSFGEKIVVGDKLVMKWNLPSILELESS